MMIAEIGNYFIFSRPLQAEQVAAKTQYFSSFLGKMPMNDN